MAVSDDMTTTTRTRTYTCPSCGHEHDAVEDGLLAEVWITDSFGLDVLVGCATCGADFVVRFHDHGVMVVRAA